MGRVKALTIPSIVVRRAFVVPARRTSTSFVLATSEQKATRNREILKKVNLLRISARPVVLPKRVISQSYRYQEQQQKERSPAIP